MKKVKKMKKMKKKWKKWNKNEKKCENEKKWKSAKNDSKNLASDWWIPEVMELPTPSLFFSSGNLPFHAEKKEWKRSLRLQKSVMETPILHHYFWVWIFTIPGPEFPTR